MRTELISSMEDENEERYIYKCACENGRIIEDHDSTPGFRDHSVILSCEECSKIYDLDTSKGVRAWELVKKLG